MRGTVGPSETGEALGPLPQEFAAIIRPELPGLIKEIGVEVTRAYPEYARLLNGPFGHGIRVGVEQSISVFVDQVAEPSAPSTLRDEMCRRFGRYEAYEGRTLDSLQGAYRLGARIALRRAQKVGRSYDLSPSTMLAFADALFAYVDELESLSREGYLEVRSRAGEQHQLLRRRLLPCCSQGRPCRAPPSPSWPTRRRGRSRRRSPWWPCAPPPSWSRAICPRTCWPTSVIRSPICWCRGRWTRPAGGCWSGPCSATGRRWASPSPPRTPMTPSAGRGAPWSWWTAGWPRTVRWCSARTIWCRCGCSRTRGCSTSSHGGSWPRSPRSPRPGATGSSTPCGSGSTPGAPRRGWASCWTSIRRRCGTGCGIWTPSWASGCGTPTGGSRSRWCCGRCGCGAAERRHAPGPGRHRGFRRSGTAPYHRSHSGDKPRGDRFGCGGAPHVS
ncbi:Regulatory protein [Streptomyces clavuligerus]|uniref:Regulatory protein n=1 Tax=Streptomyces clavuligerus TaxID=1901 RepID=E2PY72_STRCL|nr:Regulatory protein [Streptomyces clavuligerus]